MIPSAAEREAGAGVRPDAADGTRRPANDGLLTSGLPGESRGDTIGGSLEEIKGKDHRLIRWCNPPGASMGACRTMGQRCGVKRSRFDSSTPSTPARKSVTEVFRMVEFFAYQTKRMSPGRWGATINDSP